MNFIENCAETIERGLIGKLSFLRIRHYINENHALIEFFDSVLIASDEPVICLLKKCDDISTDEINISLQHGLELIKKDNSGPLKNRTALILLIFEDEIQPETLKKLNLPRKYFYQPVIIDCRSRTIQADRWNVSVSALEVLSRIGKMVREKKPPIQEPQKSAMESETIRKFQDFQRIIQSGKPYVTWLLILANLLVWGAMKYLGRTESTATLIDFGANVPPLIWQGEIWRLITPLFVHADILHLLTNCAMIYFLGGLLEPVLGSGRLFLLYILSGIMGNLFSPALSPYISAGASSGVFGILGTMICYVLANRKNIPSSLYRLTMIYLIPFLIYSVIIMPLLKSTDIVAHTGGLFGGIISFWALGSEYPPATDKRKYLWRRISLIPIFGLFLFFAFKSDPEPAVAVYYRAMGMKAVAERDMTGAISSFRNALSLEPDSRQACEMLARLYYNIGNRQMELTHFSNALKYYNDALNLLQLLPENYQFLSMLYEKAGLCLSETGKNREALNRLRKAVILAPDNVKMKRTLSNHLISMGKEKMDQFRDPEAINLFYQALEWDRGNFSAMEWLGKALYYEGHFETAGEIWRKAEKMAGEKSSADSLIREWIFRSLWQAVSENLGEADRILMENGDYRMALKVLETEMKKRGNPIEALSAMIRIHLMTGDKESARRLLEQQPERPELQGLESAILLQEGKKEPAEQKALNSLKREENFPALSVMGDIRYSEGDYDSAVKYYGSALQLDPRQTIQRLRMAQALKLSGREEQYLQEMNMCMAQIGTRCNGEPGRLICRILRKDGER